MTNDDAAFLGGALTTLGVWQLAATGRGAWLRCAFAAIVPLAGLSFAAAIKSPHRRAAVLTFLITSPILFRILGAPLGWLLTLPSLRAERSNPT